jgi:anti-sigma factor RsiW
VASWQSEQKIVAGYGTEDRDMTAGTHHHQHSDWDQQLEQLSAYLDNEVDEHERAALEQHLPTCEECRRALEELEQSRALLRAIPATALPRSFVLPETGAVPEPLSRGRRRGSAAALSSSGQRAAGAGRARALQWIGGLVAVLGLFLLISTTVPRTASLLTSGSSVGSANGGARSAQVPNTNTQTRVPSESASGSTSPTQLGRSTATATPSRVNSQPTVPATPPSATSAPLSTGENPPPLGPLTGAVLLMSGTGLLVGGTILVRKRSRRQL